MGNCQAAEMAAAVVEVPRGRADKQAGLQAGGAMYAQRLMSAYPGYFVALISAAEFVQPAASSSRSSEPAATASPCIIISPRPGAQKTPDPSPFRLLAADAPLRSGHRYRLLSFEEVLTSFSQGAGGGAYLLNNGNSCFRPAIATKNRVSNLNPTRPSHAFSDRAGYIGC